jgi:hypothetical protein
VARGAKLKLWEGEVKGFRGRGKKWEVKGREGVQISTNSHSKLVLRQRAAACPVRRITPSFVFV